MGNAITVFAEDNVSQMQCINSRPMPFEVTEYKMKNTTFGYRGLLEIIISVKIIVKEWMSTLLRDVGPSFSVTLFKAVPKMFNIKDAHGGGVPWHSQTSGRAEIFYMVFVINSLQSTRTKLPENFFSV